MFTEEGETWRRKYPMRQAFESGLRGTPVSESSLSLSLSLSLSASLLENERHSGDMEEQEMTRWQDSMGDENSPLNQKEGRREECEEDEIRSEGRGGATHRKLARHDPVLSFFINFDSSSLFLSFHNGSF